MSINKNSDDFTKSKIANCSNSNTLYDFTLNSTSIVNVQESGAAYATRRGFILVLVSSYQQSLDIFCKIRSNWSEGFSTRITYPPYFVDEPLFYFACDNNIKYQFSYQKYSGSDTSKLKIINVF